MACILPYAVSPVFPLLGKTGETFLRSANYLVEHPGGRALRFPLGVGEDVHGSGYQQSSQVELLFNCRLYGIHPILYVQNEIK